MPRPQERIPPLRERLTRALLLILAALACPVAHAALPDATGDVWVEVKSARFTVYSNAGQQAAVRAARHLERLADVLQATTQGLRVDGGREVRVYLFRDLASFKPYRPAGDDDNGITAGFQTSGPDVALIAYHIPPDADPMRFAAHEYLHAVLGRNFGALPLWVNEGLAEFYSTFSASRRTANIGLPIEEHIVWLRTKSMITLEQLMMVNTRTPDYNEGARRGTIYAESWAFVHMLVMSRGVAFSRFLSALGGGVEQGVALRGAYGANAADSLLRALGAYVERGSYNYSSWTFSDDFADVPTQVRALSSAEGLMVLGELAMRSRRSLQPLAREHLEAAWRADSTSALPAGLLCDLAEMASDTLVAMRWASAVERVPRADPRAQAVAGAALAMNPFRSYRPSWPAAGADATALRARRLLEAANDASPGRAEWLIPYGLTFLEESGSTALGVAALLTAHEAEPHRVDATAALSMLQSRAGNRAGALVLYQQLRAAPEDLAWKYWAGYLLARQTLDDANKNLKAGKPAEAETLLVHLARDVQESGVAFTARQMIDWMHEHPRATEAPNPASTFAPEVAGVSSGPDDSNRRAADSLYVAALRAARRGDFARAESLVDAAPLAHQGAERVFLDSLASEIRNQARIRKAVELLRAGKTAEACALYQQVLANHPKPDVREYVLAHQAKYCTGAKTK